MPEGTKTDRLLRETGDDGPWTLDDALRLLDDYLPSVRAAVEAVRATEGDDPQLNRLLHERVGKLASGLWDINGTNLGLTAELDRFWKASYMSRPPFHRPIMVPTLFFLEAVQAATGALRTDGSLWEQTCHSVQEVVNALAAWEEDAREGGQEGGKVSAVATRESQGALPPLDTMTAADSDRAMDEDPTTLLPAGRYAVEQAIPGLALLAGDAVDLSDGLATRWLSDDEQARLREHVGKLRRLEDRKPDPDPEKEMAVAVPYLRELRDDFAAMVASLDSTIRYHGSEEQEVDHG